MTARCPFCGRTVQTTVPAGGDGTVAVYFRHLAENGLPCIGGRAPVKETS